MSVYEFKVKNIKGEEVALESYKGKLLLVVNTASQCGFTPQYKGLEELYQKYSKSGFEVLAFPCNQFGGQEPGNDQEIASFCDLKYKTSFPLFSKVDVNGESAAPLFTYLKDQSPGIFGTKAIKWNFTKFLVDKNGKVVERFAPTDTPEKIEKTLLNYFK